MKFTSLLVTGTVSPLLVIWWTFLSQFKTFFFNMFLNIYLLSFQRILHPCCVGWPASTGDHGLPEALPCVGRGDNGTCSEAFLRVPWVGFAPSTVGVFTFSVTERQNCSKWVFVCYSNPCGVAEYCNKHVCLCVSVCVCLQCFDAVGWAAGRASGL